MHSERGSVKPHTGYSAQEFGERLKALRGERRQQEFAKALGVALNTLRRYESGERLPDAEFLASLAREASCDLHELLGVDSPVDGGVERWPTGPTLEEYPVYGEVVKTLAHARGLPQTIEELDQFSRLALGIFLRAVRISDHNARQAEIRELVLLVTQAGEENGDGRQDQTGA